MRFWFFFFSFDNICSDTQFFSDFFHKNMQIKKWIFVGEIRNFEQQKKLNKMKNFERNNFWNFHLIFLMFSNGRKNRKNWLHFNTTELKKRWTFWQVLSNDLMTICICNVLKNYFECFYGYLKNLMDFYSMLMINVCSQ